MKHTLTRFALALVVTALPCVAQRAAPVWTKVGNTGMANTWGCVFDHSGIIYCAANNLKTGGLAKSTDHGVTWSPLNTGISGCHSFRTPGVMLDGTVYAIPQACTSSDPVKGYWLNNVNGPGTTWKAATMPMPSITTGAEGASDIAPDGVTIMVPTGSGKVLRSTNNARKWTYASSTPPSSLTAEYLTIKTIGGVAFMGVAINSNARISGPGGTCCSAGASFTWFSTDNGNTWNSLGLPSQVSGCSLRTECSLDANLGPTSGINGNFMTTYIGASGTKTGFYCWSGGTPPTGNWRLCNTNAWAGNGGNSNAIFGMATNRTGDRIVGIWAEDDGYPVIYSDDGATWQLGSSGITCTSPNCSTRGGLGAKTASVITDPTTGYMYIFTKNGDVFRTTTSQHNGPTLR